MRQAAPGYGAHGAGSIIGTVASVAVAATPAIVAVALTNSAPAVVRDSVLLPCAAAYGFALAWAGVRLAANAAEGRLPELCQVALRGEL